MSVVSKAIWLPNKFGSQHYCCSSCELFLALQSLCKQNANAIAVDLLHVFNVHLSDSLEAKCINCKQLVGTRDMTNLNLKNIVLKNIPCEFDQIRKYIPILTSGRVYGCSKCFRLVHFSGDIIEEAGRYKVVSKICAANLSYDLMGGFVLTCFCGEIQGFSSNDTNIILDCEDLSDKIEKVPVHFA